MQIADNIIRAHLANVLFISGGAYGGKTTMTRALEAKYGFIRYREGDMWERHAAIATPANQPALSTDRSSDWHAFLNQPVEQYYQWLNDGVREEAEMAIVDLMALAQDRMVVADAMIPVDILERIAGREQVVLLYAPVEMKRKHYFDRDDKKPLLDLIYRLPEPEATLENVLNALTYRGEEEIQEYLDSGFRCIMRTDESTIEGTLAEIERHFGLG